MNFDSLNKTCSLDIDRKQSQKHDQEPLALIGIGCRFPGGVRDAESFWNLIASGTSAITEVPAERWNADRFYHPDPEGTQSFR